MASNITERQYSGADAQLSEPHFEEEATLLSARPVVPLHEVKAEQRSGRRLVLGLGLVAAVMVGALAATLVYRQLSQSPATATVDTAAPVSNEAAPEVSATTQADGGTSVLPASGSIGVETVSKAATREVRNSSNTRPLRPAAAGVTRTDSRWTTDANQAEEVQTDDKRAERRAERQEAKRLRREAERQARRNARIRKGESNDLLRIREIFEGSPRP